MPFLRAGFNPRSRGTGIHGWTRPRAGSASFAPAKLRRFRCGDLYWRGARFLAWGEQCVLGSHWGFDLPHEWTYEHGLPHSDLATREEHKGIDWTRYR